MARNQTLSSDRPDGADALLLAVHWLRFDDVLEQAGDLSGKIVITCSLPMNEGNTELVVGRSASVAAPPR
jgi:predicted dinucleotide-binding enzyme